MRTRHYIPEVNATIGATRAYILIIRDQGRDHVPMRYTTTLSGKTSPGRKFVMIRYSTDVRLLLLWASIRLIVELPSVGKVVVRPSEAVVIQVMDQEASALGPGIEVS